MRKNSKTKIAHVYATALYEAAEDKGVVETVKDDVAKLLGLVHDEKDLGAYLANPLWSLQDKNDVLEQTANLLKLSDETINCLKVVVENGRVSDLGLILSGFEKIYFCKNNIVKVKVETVKKLSSSQDNKLKKVMKDVLGCDVVLDYSINPKILGGLRVQCGSKMFDNSLASKLNYLENIMKGK